MPPLYSSQFERNHQDTSHAGSFYVEIPIVPLQEAVYRRIIDTFYAIILYMDPSFIQPQVYCQ
jgi:hypothetical protein